jgi:hypothetical protein
MVCGSGTTMVNIVPSSHNGDPVTFDCVATRTDPATTPTATPTATPTPTPGLCDDPATPKLTASVNVNIPDNTGATCPWGSADNLGQKPAKMRARRTINVPVAIPNGIICALNATTAGTSTIFYDDVLILTIENFLIVTNTSLSYFPLNANGFQEYNWLNVRDGKYLTGAAASCGANVTSCSMPHSEDTGKITFNISMLNKIFGATPRNSINFAATITGDNDPARDCQLRSNIKFNLGVTYIPK